MSRYTPDGHDPEAMEDIQLVEAAVRRRLVLEAEIEDRKQEISRLNRDILSCGQPVTGMYVRRMGEERRKREAKEVIGR